MQVNVSEYLDGAAAQLPDKVAVVDAAGSYTFRQLREKALAWAAQLAGPDDPLHTPIAVYLPKCRQAVLSFAAILYSGSCYAPLDVKSPAPRLAAILKKLGPRLTITDRRGSQVLQEAGFNPERIVLIEDLDDESRWHPGRRADLSGRVQKVIDTDPVYVIHTSGSTGVPKGVTICHRGVIDYIEWARETYGIDDSFTIGSQAPFHFDNSTLDLYLCLAAGTTLVLVPEEKYHFPATLLPYLREHGVDLIFWVPSVLVTIANQDLLSQMELPALRWVLFAGEVMPAKHLNYWRTWFPQARFSNLYGPTEITVDCTYYIVERDFADSEPLPIGFPCRNTDVLILNDQNQLAAPGEIGELCVRGSSLALGYWNDPGSTAAAFCQNPLQTHYPERIYRTGDLVRTNQDGEIVFLGRADGQIKHLGYRIELGEIETAAFTLAEIQNACVLYDKNESQIILVYESKEALNAGQIRAALGKQLPKYMLPSVCLWMNRMPLNANGKTDRQELLRTLRTAST